MSPVRAKDLSPEVRKRLGINAGSKPRRNTKRGVDVAADCPGCCYDCGQEFESYTKWERHADAAGHRRWQMSLLTAPSGAALPSGDTGEAL